MAEPFTALFEGLAAESDNEASLVIPTNLGILTVSMHFEPYEQLEDILEGN